MAVFYENDALSILVLSTKKGYSSFLKKVFIFQKSCFKVKVLKTFKIFTDCRIKTCQSLKWRNISKIPIPLVLKWNFWKKIFSSIKTKTSPNFAVKLAWRSNHSFLLSIWWITFFKQTGGFVQEHFQTCVLLVRDIACVYAPFFSVNKFLPSVF